jgi:hypothetical protein
MALNINPIQGGYVFPKGFIYARFEGQTDIEELGNAETFEINVEVERDELEDNRFGTSVTADSQVTSIKTTVSMTLRQMTDRNRALGVMGSVGYLNQEAEEDKVLTFEGAKAGQVFALGGFDLTDISVTDGEAVDPATLVAGTDYLVDAKAGLFQTLKDGDYKVTFSKPAIAAASTKRLKTGIGGNPDIRCELIYVGTNKNGPKPFVKLWDVRLSPAGARGYVSASDRGTIQLSGEAIADGVKALAEGNAEEFIFGYETTLSN